MKKTKDQYNQLLMEIMQSAANKVYSDPDYKSYDWNKMSLKVLFGRMNDNSDELFDTIFDVPVKLLSRDEDVEKYCEDVKQGCVQVVMFASFIWDNVDIFQGQNK